MKANEKIGIQFRIIQEHLKACEQEIEAISFEDYQSWREIEDTIFRPIHAVLSDVSDYDADLTECAQLISWFERHGWTLEIELDAPGVVPYLYQYYLYPVDQPDCQIVKAHKGFPTFTGLCESIENELKLTANDIAVNWLDFIEAPVSDDDLTKKVEAVAEKLMDELPALLKELEQAIASKRYF